MSGDNEKAERKSFEATKLRLRDAFATPDSEYELLSTADIRKRALSVLTRH